MTYTVTPEGTVYRLTLADGRTALFISEADAYRDAARLAVADQRSRWGFKNRERRTQNEHREAETR